MAAGANNSTLAEEQIARHQRIQLGARAPGRAPAATARSVRVGAGARLRVGAEASVYAGLARAAAPQRVVQLPDLLHVPVLVGAEEGTDGAVGRAAGALIAEGVDAEEEEQRAGQAEEEEEDGGGVEERRLREVGGLSPVFVQAFLTSRQRFSSLRVLSQGPAECH